MAMMRAFIVFILAICISTPYYSKGQSTSYSDKYLIELNIPSTWQIKRNIEGNDYTLTASSSGDEFFLYYVQFMDDKKKQPKRYLDTYASQFGLDAKMETATRTINGKKQKFYFVRGKGEVMEEKTKVFIWATAIDNKNIAAYLIYPVDAPAEVDEKAWDIMLGDIGIKI